MRTFKEFRTINESKLETLTKKWEDKGMTVFVFENEEYIKIMSLIIPKSERKSGTGTAIMNDITDYADSINKMIVLTPGVKDPYQGTTSRSRLVKFYKRFGFVENKGRNKDFAINAGDMYRKSISGRN